jgi:hypothetical protein
MIYGYGIVDVNGLPWWWEESCVCKDRSPLDEVVKILNEVDDFRKDARCPYTVVQLNFRCKNGKFI